MFTPHLMFTTENLWNNVQWKYWQTFLCLRKYLHNSLKFFISVMYGKSSCPVVIKEESNEFSSRKISGWRINLWKVSDMHFFSSCSNLWILFLFSFIHLFLSTTFTTLTPLLVQPPFWSLLYLCQFMHPLCKDSF